jgi:hypothetical protein
MAINEIAWEIVKHHLRTHYIGPTGPCCDKCSEMLTVVENALSIGYANGFAAYKDDPELDSTDFAHPAWRRGNEHAHFEFVYQVNKILDGELSNEGTSSMPWEALRQRLYDIRTLLGIAERVIGFARHNLFADTIQRTIATWDKIRADYDRRRNQ